MIARVSLLVAAFAFGLAPVAHAAQDQPPAPPAKPADAPPPPPTPAVATDPALAVATVKLEGGYRASKVIGAAVYNGENQQIGTVDELILNHENQATLAVISVGGFLGVGGKMVALPYGKIMRTEDGKILLQDGSKESLAKLPSFAYAQ
jgi:sporulation protein YlmC with PRC-barrel domain